MTTTTIRLEDDLKARIAAAAGLAGKTAHAFILEAISQTVEQVELDHEFHGLAAQRWAKIKTTGKTVSWDEARTYLQAKANGDSPKKPKSRNVKA
jgi:predicted transcriptional regulator